MIHTEETKRRVRERLSIGGLNACWEWQGTRHGRTEDTRYGHISIGGRGRRVHRVAYELWRGPIPEGFTIDHLCRNPGCANPRHLEPVTNKKNILRGNGWAARNARKTHCPQGHEYTIGNLYVTPKGDRRCRECAREKSRKWWNARGSDRRRARRVQP